MKRFHALLAATLGAALVLSACASTGRPVAASVDGTEISRPDLDDDLGALAANKKLVAQTKQQGLDLVPTDGGFDTQVASSWLSSLVSQVVIDEEFERRGLKVTNQGRTQAEQSISQNFGGPTVFGDFPKWFRDEVTGRQARLDAVRTALEQEQQATDAELLQIYGQNRDALCASGKLVAHILVRTQAEADAVEAQLAQGANFADLARQISIDTGSAPVGGVLTCIDSQQWPQYDATFRAGAQALAVGEISAPVQTQFGYHVITVTDFTFENARPFLETLLRQQQGDPVQVLVNRELARAKVTVDPRYGKVVKSDQGVSIRPPAEPKPKRKPASKQTTTTTAPPGTSTP